MLCGGPTRQSSFLTKEKGFVGEILGGGGKKLEGRSVDYSGAVSFSLFAYWSWEGTGFLPNSNGAVCLILGSSRARFDDLN